MKRLAVLLAVLAALTPRTATALSADSIKAFTGAARIKAVWNRTTYCNEDYTPVASATTAMMFLDSDNGVAKVINSGGGGIIRISHSGKWVTWNSNSKTYILDLTAATPTPRVLLDKATVSYFYARTWWIDPATKQEYVFCLNNYGPIPGGLTHGDGIYKVAINADGTAGTATKLTIDGNPYVDDYISVSQDGKKLGGAFPWPDTKILDIPTGRLDLRHVPGFGCQAALAPDNSYRFSHCEGDHFGIFIFAANMVDQNTYINLSHNLAFFAGKDGMDFGNVHWSNNVQFMCSSPPIGDNYDYYDFSHYSGQTAAWIKANTDINGCKKTIFHKYTADFKDIESSIAIADIRYAEADGDIWLSNGVGGDQAVSSSAVVKTTAESPIQVAYAGDLIALRADQRALSQVMVVDPRGKLVRRWSAQGNAFFGVKDLNPGTYCIIATSGEFGMTKRISVKR